MKIVLPAPRWTPLVVVLSAQGVLALLGLLWLGWSLRPPQPSEPPAGGSPVGPAASAPDPRAGAAEARDADRPRGLVELGQGRALLLAPDGRLIVLQADGFSGELRLERVYELTNDPDRHLGTPLRRAHGYYLEDVERAASERVKAERARFDQVVDEAAEGRTADLEDAEAAARRLVAAGGASELLPLLDPVGAERTDAVRRHAAAFALGGAGYTVAVEALAGLLEQHRESERLAPRLKRLISGLTGLALEPLPADDVIAAARDWAAAHPPAERPVRVELPNEGR